MAVLDREISMLERITAPELRGQVTEVRGLALRVASLAAPVGATVRIHSNRGHGQTLEGEVVGFAGNQTIVMPVGSLSGVGRGDRVIVEADEACVPVGESLLGRVIGGSGRPIDGKGKLQDTVPKSLNPEPIDPLARPPIDQPLATGLRAIDAMTPLGRGQRLGVFASPGVGKSTLLASCARNTDADVSVIGLIGERGREVRDFLDKTLGEEGLARSAVVCATGDEPPLLRIRAAHHAAALAEHFRAQGKHVLLVMDSITRLCQAQREVGLASGEPPTTRGYPPSVFAMLPSLLERAGRTQAGSITGLYAVLVEGDELTDPVADASRGVLDGHIQLSPRLAQKGQYPAIDVPGSISRCADDVTDAEHTAARREVLSLISNYREVEDLVNVGAYAQGSNPDYDLAIALKPTVDQLLGQGRSERPGKADFQRTRAQLLAVKTQITHARADLEARRQGQPSAGAASR